MKKIASLSCLTSMILLAGCAEKPPPWWGGGFTPTGTTQDTSARAAHALGCGSPPTVTTSSSYDPFPDNTWDSDKSPKQERQDRQEQLRQKAEALKQGN